MAECETSFSTLPVSGVNLSEPCNSSASTAHGEREGQTSPSTTEDEIAAGGASCAATPSPLTSIDLSKPSDLNLIHRALVNNWPIAEHVREQVRAQLLAAMNCDDHRSANQFKKLEALAAGMDMRHLLDRSVGRGALLNPRKRNPNRRQLRALGRQRAREALHQRVTAQKGMN